MNTEKRYEKLISLESKYKLFSLKLKNKYSIWSAFRVYFDYMDLENKNLFESPTKKITIKDNFIDFMKYLIRFDYIKIFLKKRKIIILEHPRGDEKDIYTSDLLKCYKKNEVLRISFTNHFKNLRKTTLYLDIFKVVSKIISKIGVKFLNDNKFWNFKKFIKEFESNEDFTNKYKEYYIEVLIMFYFYKLLFLYHKPEKIYVVVSYLNVPIIFAARELNIPVIEIQHGIIYKYHLGYNYFNYLEEYQYSLPNYMALFSDYWNRNLYLPQNIQTFTIGNNVLYIDNNNINKEENTVLFISQAVIGTTLSIYLEKNICFLENYKIFFKLHPQEFELLDIKYNNLLTLSKKYKNLIVVKKEYSIDFLQNMCEYQVGVFSTSIYEGIQRQCKTMVLDIEGIEAIDDLIENNYVEKISFDSKLQDTLAKSFVVKDVEFFSKFKGC